MAVRTWKFRYHDGNKWSTQYSISNPTNDIMVELNSTRRKHNLYDGSIGRTIPTTKYTYSTVDLEWAFISGTNPLLLRNVPIGSALALHNIMSGGFKVEFTTHTLTSGATTTSQVWQGYLTSYPRTYKLGLFPTPNRGYETYYDLSVTLDLVSLV